ncbi:hypothetical protein P152DRAFT_455859 [Eremomyces bilateralis CBS 781.70]|uniref:Uncharacterized protein n=1 Tax=Eremomyces bilateralis CBS 781.70 TaxID=1392243 RepID=A0A6G1G9Z7_9PEZI|nr:uncharacterized protein P152DRAFT_455859 [Eremomyces bilateralis CBS 781.70]KAF1814822.1 hypothetical protein P152DRAFT_455859 [Eremomyces bilateralis CBS 781.70]
MQVADGANFLPATNQSHPTIALFPHTVTHHSGTRQPTPPHSATVPGEYRFNGFLGSPFLENTPYCDAAMMIRFKSCAAAGKNGDSMYTCLLGLALGWLTLAVWPSLTDSMLAGRSRFMNISLGQISLHEEPQQ